MLHSFPSGQQPDPSSPLLNGVCFISPWYREKKLKARVQELVSALERLTKSSEIRHQQSAEFVNDLKRANRYNLTVYSKWFLDLRTIIAGNWLWTMVCPQLPPWSALLPRASFPRVPQKPEECSLKRADVANQGPLLALQIGAVLRSHTIKNKSQPSFNPAFSKQNWLHNILFEQHSRIRWGTSGSNALRWDMTPSH